MGYKKDKWEEWELDILRAYFPNYGVKKCAEFITRHSEHAIAKKAQYIGLRINVTEQKINLGLKKLSLPTYQMIGRNGYIMYRDKYTKKYTALHRKIMSEHLGRELLLTEIVHHKDGNKLNNDISNLEIVSRKEHMATHRKDLLYARQDIVRHSAKAERG